MFEIKRSIIKRAINEIGVIKESQPEESNIMDNSVNYYKFILKSDEDIEKILKLSDTTDIYFISISEGVTTIEIENIDRNL